MTTGEHAKGDPSYVGTAQIMFTFSGDRNAFEAHESRLKALGGTTHRLSAGADAGPGGRCRHSGVMDLRIQSGHGHPGLPDAQRELALSDGSRAAVVTLYSLWSIHAAGRETG